MNINLIRRWWLAAMVLLLCGNAQGQALVQLDARDPSAGTSVWRNEGTLGSFKRVGQPQVVTLGGVRAVLFNGKTDAYQGPITVPTLESNAPRTIEVWADNPTVDSDEETLVSWGRRGADSGSMLAFGWGRSPAYGAATHWAQDMGWNGVPRPGRWHLLAYTYDGTTARIYDDGVQKAALPVALKTQSSTRIIVAAEAGASGQIQFLNEFTHQQQAGSLAIASVRILSVALSASQILQDFNADAARFGAKRSDAEGILGQGTQTFSAGTFNLTLLRASGTAASLSPRDSDFDFLPGDRLAGRAFDGFYQLGDLNLRLRSGPGAWVSFSSAANRETPVTGETIAGTLAAQNITAALGAQCPLRVIREWVRVKNGLALRFVLTNRTSKPVEIGALGAPMIFNNILTGRTLGQAHDHCSFADPYMGGPAGYLQVTRLSGQGPALLVLPERGNSFEAYRPLHDDPTPRSVTFEGFYEWMAHSKAYAQNEWRQAQPWNPATSRILKPAQTVTYGFLFVLSPTIKAIEPTLIAQGRPVVIGVPGYVLPTDQTGRLFVHSPAPVVSLTVSPTGAMRLRPDLRPTRRGWRGYTLRGDKTGRCRLTLTYADGRRQFVQYRVILPETTQVRHLGHFLAAKQWYTDPSDPFHRTASFMPYDREHHTLVLQRENSWAVGLSDEMGAGASVAMAMKNLERPNPQEIALLERYVDTTLAPHVQTPDHGVKASLFYYQPEILPNYHYTVHGGWDKARGDTTWRAYNYPHVTAVYWALYHLARDHRGLVKDHPWEWYLEQAYDTAMAMQTHASGLDQFGLMVGSVFPALLDDLRREGWITQADTLETYMHRREQHWVSLRYPFGSEMPWDSTGQEEIYTWCQRFGDVAKAQVTLHAITGYVPAVPNWAYNGAARRYFDEAVNNTRWPDIMRITNHYGSALNAIPVLDAYRRDPTEFYLLRIGYAGMDQPMANIDSEGFGSGDFDCDPAILKFDPFTSDYGIGFYGYARNAGTYVLHHPEFGWLAFGGYVTPQRDGTILVRPRDAFRKRLFLAPLGLWLTLDAGTFERVLFNPLTRTVRLTLSAATPHTPTALLRLVETQTGNLTAHFHPGFKFPRVRGAFEIPLQLHAVTVTIKP